MDYGTVGSMQSLISTGFRNSSSLQMTRGDLGLISTVDIALPSVFTRVNGATADLGGKKVGIGTTRVSQMTSEMSGVGGAQKSGGSIAAVRSLIHIFCLTL